VPIPVETGGDLNAQLTGQVAAQVSFPSGSHTESFTITFQTLATPPPLGGQFQLLGRSFSLTAVSESGQPVTHFSKPFTITIAYTDESVAGLDESLLALHYWNAATQEWITLHTTVDAANNRLLIVLDHLTVFAILDNPTPRYYPHRLYLPVIRRGI